ncbi:phage holin family protein [Hymenobacter sp. BT491]|uniref:phage holin family protein n=1 Tax=Hymenobacter sp. BT491 TaxID=2766779 RepID=UPI0016535634|nr:phage holin family protein [Hymenobacter sp. BT491]MBC6988569.1 phage holin family protein [Hymenobacter sp. BT491]
MYLLIQLAGLLQMGALAFQKYVFADWNFIGYLLVVFVVDTALGVWLSLKQHRHHSRQFRGMFEKFIQYGAVLIMVHVLCEFTVDGQKNSILVMLVPHFKAVMYLAVLWAEVKSIDENLRGLGFKGLPFPPFLRKRLADWEETGQLAQPAAPAAADPSAELPTSISSPIQEGITS